MLNETIIGISQALDSNFGFTIYTENVEQDLDTPCFMITVLNPSQEQVVGNRYEYRQPFDVHFFPSDRDRGNVIGIIEKLYNCLEYIMVDGNLIRGTDMNTKTVDGVLHFFVDYNVFVIKKNEDVIKMEDLDVNVMERMGT